MIRILGLRKFAWGVALAMAALGSEAAFADTTLLDLTNVTGTAHYNVDFTATSANTTLNVGGYNLPNASYVANNTVSALGSTTNLLGQNWSFTPAPSGSSAGQGSIGTAVNRLVFGGVSIGSYDTFSQTFSTSVGQGYTYAFDYNGLGSPSGLRVTANVAAGVGPSAPAPQIGFGWLSALAAAMALVATRALPLRRKAAQV